MKRNDRTRSIYAGVLRSALSLALAACMLFSMLPTAFAGSSVGNSASSLTPSTSKTFIQIGASPLFFTGSIYGVGSTVTPGPGSVWQLVTDDYYTSSEDHQEYYGVYYQSKRYNVLKSDVEANIMSTSEVTNFITNVIWNQPSYATLKKDMGLVGDIRVYALQYALNALGYSIALDGDYGDKTSEVVKKFQKSNGLSADGSAGPITQAALYPMASGGGSGGTGGSGDTGGNGGAGGAIPSTGALKTTDSVNLRKTASTKAPRLAVVPKGVSLSYTASTTAGGVSWYKVNYNSLTGWLMGTFTNAGNGSGGGSSGGAVIGTVTITKKGTHVRKAANGSTTGTMLAIGTVVNLIGQPTTAGGFTWYPIRTAAGLNGFVRGDCSTANLGGGGTGGGGISSTDKTFIKLVDSAELFTTVAKPSSGALRINAGTVLQMVSSATYTSGGETYCSLYYNNKKYNAVYDDVKNGILSSSALAEVVQSFWNNKLNGSLKSELNLIGDARVYAMQLALNVTGFYTGALDGSFGSGSKSAVRNFQRRNKLTVDGACGNETWTVLCAQAKSISSGGGTGGGIVSGDFGTVNSVEKTSWATVDGGKVSLFKKGSSATVMDVGTGKVFTVYRWSGGKHADCVPYTSADTKVMCDIVNFPYNSAHPSSSQLSKIKADDVNSTKTYSWPDFKNAFGSGKDIGSNWDRRPGLLNIGGRVFCVSIYGYPHGFNGTDAFAKSQFPNGSYFYAQNNYYGMMCIHFVGSTTHTATTPDEGHQRSITEAYNYAKSRWPTLVK